MGRLGTTVGAKLVTIDASLDGNSDGCSDSATGFVDKAKVGNIRGSGTTLVGPNVEGADKITGKSGDSGGIATVIGMIIGADIGAMIGSMLGLSDGIVDSQFDGCSDGPTLGHTDEIASRSTVGEMMGGGITISNGSEVGYVSSNKLGMQIGAHVGSTIGL